MFVAASSLRVVILAACVYALLVLIMWMPFGPHNGLGGELAFPNMSETSSLMGGFLYPSDALRIHTNTFYHLSYLIGEALGIGGSYIPYQVVYALLWWARGLLAFLLMRRFLPGSLTLSYVVGALVVVHASDGALQFIGQMNQFGFIFWMLLAFYFFAAAFDASRSIAVALLTLAALCFEYMSLWSYESQILLLLVFPVVLLVHRHRSRRRLAVMSLLWYSLPALYVWLTIEKYRLAAGHTYQERLIRKSFALNDLLGDLSFNVAASLEFWTWPRREYGVPGHAGLLSLLASLAFVAGGAAVLRLAHESGRPNFLVSKARTWWGVLAAGFVFLVLSFPVYLLLDSARGLWRTQFLSGIGTGLMWTAALGLVCAYSRFVPSVIRVAAFLALGGVIVCAGTLAAIQKGSFERSLWEQHRAAIMNILRAAPRVKPDTVVVLLNVPRNDDPFGDALWLDMALRLVYPGIPVVGTYFYDDRTPAPGRVLEADGERWRWNRTGYEPLILDTTIANTVIVDHKPQGTDSLVKTMPLFLCHAPCDVELYHPADIISGSISPRAARRYQLPSDTFHVASGGISVRTATYGQSCYGAALPAGNTNSVTRGNVTRFVDRACSGQDVCDFKITSQFLGDPAPYCGKDFRVQWTCPDGRSEEVTAPAEALGETIRLRCSAAHAG